MDYLTIILKALGNLLFNPIFYWIIVLSLLPSDERIKLEETNFNQKILPLGTELKNTLIPSLIMTIVMFIFTLGFKVTFPYEAIIILSVIFILLSYKMKYSLLSASYTLGITYLVLWFLPKGPLEEVLYTDWTFTSITIMISILLFAEAILFLRFRNSEANPKLAYSKRGRWYGVLQMRKLSIVPLLLILPNETDFLTNAILPSISFGDEHYTLFIMPFALGFNHLFQGDLPEKYSKNIGFTLILLSLSVLSLSLGSLKLPKLSLFALAIAVVGRGIIHYFFYRLDLKKNLYFLEGQEQLKVLGVVSGSKAETCGFQTGDLILTLNGKKTSSIERLNELLQEGMESSLVEFNRKRSKLRYIEIKDFKGDSSQFGLIFALRPVQSNKSTADG